jgi:hypothetical protein
MAHAVGQVCAAQSFYRKPQLLPHCLVDNQGPRAGIHQRPYRTFPDILFRHIPPLYSTHIDSIFQQDFRIDCPIYRYCFYCSTNQADYERAETRVLNSLPLRKAGFSLYSGISKGITRNIFARFSVKIVDNYPNIWITWGDVKLHNIHGQAFLMYKVVSYLQ